MDEKVENDNTKKSKKKKILFLVIFLLLLLPAVIYLVRSRQSKDTASDGTTTQEEEVVENQGDDAIIDNEITKKESAGLTNIDKAIVKDEAEMVSENYRVSQVKFTGNAVIENGKSRDTKLEIYQVKSENIISQEDNEPSILISWKTNKEAISSVEYAKSDGKNPVKAIEDGYGFEHTMMLKNMEFSTIYTYRIESKDKWGNKVSTEYFSAYTGDKSESIFDLITNAVEDVFGWAM
jgi:flagellar basal body-associated protein FliL